jgi:ribokinase
MRQEIIVVGSINLDLVVNAGRIPREGETLHGNSFQTFFGGKGANQAVASSRLGAAVTMIGKVGTDSFGPELLRGLQSAGVRTNYVRPSKGSSGVALITTDKGGQNSIVVVPGANGQVLSQDIERYRSRIEKAAIVLAQLEIPMASVEHLATITSKSGVPLMLDPAPAMRLSRKLLCSVAWLTPNETESATLLGDRDERGSVEAIADRILSLGCRNVVLKLGAKGVYLAGGDTPRLSVKGFKVKPVDTTAAGDAFNGAFAVAIVRGNSPAEAARFACAVAAISVTRAGAQPSMPTNKEVEAFLRRERSSY